VRSRTRRQRLPSTPRSTDVGRTATAALLACLALGTGCRPALPDLGAVPPFALTDRSGASVSERDLDGHVWIADFVFTHCPDFCPALTARMAHLQATLPADHDPVRLVSITVDPVRDTPDVLDGYARQVGARPEWLFLTGARDAVAALLRDGFRVAFADDGPPDSPITHSDRFVLVDRHRRIRGYYHGTEPEDVDRLARDAVGLRAER
jgi:protein SCO1/2